MISRRHFLGAAAGALLTAAAAEGGGNGMDRARAVEQFLCEFPDASALPGIAEIRSTFVHGAQRVFALFPQIHWDDELGDMAPRLNLCQHNLRLAMEALLASDTAHFHHIFNEGMFVGQKQYLDYYFGEFQRLTGHADVHSNRALGIINRDGSSVLGYTGAAEILALRGKLTLEGAEDVELRRSLARYKLLCSLTRGEESADAQRRYDEIAYAKREHFLTSIIGQSPHMVNYAVFGEAHEWGDDVRRYNASHPDSPMAFMEIVPIAVARWRAHKARILAMTE